MPIILSGNTSIRHCELERMIWALYDCTEDGSAEALMKAKFLVFGACPLITTTSVVRLGPKQDHVPFELILKIRDSESVVASTPIA